MGRVLLSRQSGDPVDTRFVKFAPKVVTSLAGGVQALGAVSVLSASSGTPPPPTALQAWG